MGYPITGPVSYKFVLKTLTIVVFPINPTLNQVKKDNLAIVNGVHRYNIYWGVGQNPPVVMLV